MIATILATATVPAPHLTDGSPRNSRDRQRHLAYPATWRSVEPPSGSDSQPRARNPNAPVGKHQYQESALSRRSLRRRLIGLDTINTITPTTLEAFRDHATSASIEDNIDDARGVLPRSSASESPSTT